MFLIENHTQNLNFINSDKDKKGIKKTVTRSLSAAVIKTISLSSCGMA